MKILLLIFNVLTIALIGLSIFFYFESAEVKSDDNFNQQYFVDMSDKTMVISNDVLSINSTDGSSVQIAKSNYIGDLNSFKSNFKTIIQGNDELLVNPLSGCNILKIGINDSKQYTDLVCLKNL